MAPVALSGFKHKKPMLRGAKSWMLCCEPVGQGTGGSLWKL